MKKQNEQPTVLLTGPQAISFLGVSRSKFLALRKDGLIRPIIDSPRDPLYAREDLLQLPARIRDQANSANS